MTISARPGRKPRGDVAWETRVRARGRVLLRGILARYTYLYKDGNFMLLTRPLLFALVPPFRCFGAGIDGVNVGKDPSGGTLCYVVVRLHVYVYDLVPRGT